MSNSTIEVRDLREQNWIWTSNDILFHPDIKGNDYKVYCGLAAYANNHSQKAFPSIATMAKRLHMGRSTVMRGLSTLEATGVVKIEKKTGEHNIYFLLKIIEGVPSMKKPKAMDGETPAEGNWVKTMLEWAEKRRASKFVVYGKQIGAIGMMQKAGYVPREICECYLMMEKSQFWKERGFDFTNVANELPKKINSIRKSHGAPVFDHLTAR